MSASFEQTRRQRARSGPALGLAADLYNASIPQTTVPAIPPSLIPGNINGVRSSSPHFPGSIPNVHGSTLPPGAMIPGPARRRDYSSPPGRPSSHYTSPVRGATSPPLPVKPWADHSSPPLPPKFPLTSRQGSALSFYNTAVVTASPGPYTTTFPPAPMLHVPEPLRAPSPVPARLPTPGPRHTRHEPPLSQHPAPLAEVSSVVRPIPVSAAPSAALLVAEPDPFDEEIVRQALEASMREEASKQDLASREEEELARALEASMGPDSSQRPEVLSMPIASTSTSHLYSRPQPKPPSVSLRSIDQESLSSSQSTTTVTLNSPTASSLFSTVTYDRSSIATSLQPAPAVPALLIKHTTPPLEVAQSAPAVTSAALSEYPFPQSHADISRADQLVADEALARRLALDDDAQSQDTTHSSASISTSSPTHSSTPQGIHSQPQSHFSSPKQETLIPQRRAHSTSDLPSIAPTFASSSSKQPTVVEEDMPKKTVSTGPTQRSANQFVEPELLMGLSFGFFTPPMTPHQVLWKEPIPNIFSLPYGKAPPMHIQATSWKHLLRLAAKLSATRVEPALDALAVTKDPLRLRVVVQFIKNHHASNDWRTVIYLTVDHPPPPKLPTIAKYTSADPNQLPFSYTLSSKPALLRDGPENALSKYFAIPPTATMPLPALPITLPNLALYLAQALEDSRRAAAAKDEVLGRLARLVDSCYPMDAALDEEDDGPGGRRGLRNFAGRFMKRNKQQVKSRNADVYELVTPFVPDEWG